ncbi:MAG: hypothetical protein N2V78_01840 [Methanophagales archaeon]|nr:hypothetical protein [Methanophagales archaeon]
MRCCEEIQAQEVLGGSGGSKAEIAQGGGTRIEKVEEAKEAGGKAGG